ncbi:MULTISPECIES: hypothetical protein [unclassified Leeuwenhoekiella]|uniref:phosphoribosyltransferase-like protein n=1 Tax=unclassified Leeuwenhoekiella TaxID=2615029 RepID=UPI000C4B98BE|nr:MULTISPECIES: hypothetical protein [unclassified Leeuwenhoekiella]MAW95682.1 hypothetical protein [Leeuwenhoekiella sp.]MBA80768.1 hypothetical protein [Leeuwenhoekiella sp.]|tara:strand:+ start:633 stop:1487 length:855 start_codon:yes stop_codon:yes gene_type:complete
MTTVESITYLNKIFKAKKWTDRDIDEYVFDNFCNLLDNLNDRERELIIELVERYQWITSLEYQEKILSTLESVENEKVEKLKTAYLFPIIKLEDEGKVKSGTFLMYQIKAFKKFLKKHSKVEFRYVTKFEYLTDVKFELKDEETIYLIDDYIGSGETVNACLTELRKNKNIGNDKLNIVTIAIQKETSDLISKDGISIYTDYYSPKGLTDFNDSPVREEKIALMREIEKLIPGGSHFSLGYNECEALITLARTPDNTFPIFWKKHRIGTKYFDAPFSREETFEI